MKKIAIIALVFSASAGALAQGFPAKPVRLVVAFPAGGGVDIVARLLSPKLAEAWGQQVIVDNRAGASGVIGTEFAARSAPDGHTLFIGTLGNLAVNPHLFAKMPVDPLRDFAPITHVVGVLQDAGVSAKLSAMGATAVGNTPEQFGAVLRADSEKWGKLIREADIRAE